MRKHYSVEISQERQQEVVGDIVLLGGYFHVFLSPLTDIHIMTCQRRKGINVNDKINLSKALLSQVYIIFIHWPFFLTH